MPKKYWIIGLVLVVVLILGYAYKHQIKLLLMGSSSQTPTTSGSNLYGAPPAGPSNAPMRSGNIIATQTGAKGAYLVGASGMTLYNFDKDKAGVSNCTGSCATTWPPYMASSGSSKLPTNVSVITRSDGSMQYAYKGLPLYYYSGDSQPGDTNGDGFNGLWHLVKP